MAALQKAFRPSLHPLIAKARSAFADHFARYDCDSAAPHRKPLIFVACSGGPDSLALASVAQFYHRRGEIKIGAIVLDHALQNATAEVSKKTVRTLRQLGLDPVIHQEIRITNTGIGLEAAARSARYQAFMKIAVEYGAVAIATGHQADDQAEQVLLGLARGSGTRSLSGIAPRRILAERNGDIYYLSPDPPNDEKLSGVPADAMSCHTVDIVRPFLGLTKQELRKICTLEKLDYWEDPSNHDPSYLRSRIRTEILPYLIQSLDPGLSQALSRTAAINRADDDFISAQASAVFHLLAERRNSDVEATVTFDIAVLRSLPEAIRHRVYKEAKATVQKPAGFSGKSFGVESLSWERFHAIDSLIFNNHNNKKIQTSGAHPHQHIQWLKHKGPSPAASLRAKKFLSAYGRYYSSLNVVPKGDSARLKSADLFGSVGKCGTLVIRIKYT